MEVGPDLPGGKENLQHAPDFPQRCEMMPGGADMAKEWVYQILPDWHKDMIKS